MDFHGIPWNCSCQRNWSTSICMEFHWIPWYYSWKRNWRIPSSMEFDGTARVSEICTLQIPRNFMELLVSSKLAHSTFHGIPWNWWFQLNWRTPHSMELLVSRDWCTPSSMELLVSAKLAHFKFHGMPWNCWCQRNWRIPSSMKFRGTAGVSEIRALEVPLNPMEFHATAGVSETGALLVPLNSMEFHGTVRVIEIGAFQVPWNSMELLVSVPWNSIEPIVCYLMDPLVSSIHRVLNWDRIPWNLSFQILMKMKIIFNCAGWINFRKLINALNFLQVSFTNWCFIINICIIPYAFPALLMTYKKISQNLFSMLIETYFDQKVPWNFL